MVWQILSAIIFTVVLGLSSILLKVNLAQRKMALVQFASHDYVEITKGASAYIADESSALLKSVQNFIYSKDDSENALEALAEDFNQFNAEMNSELASSISEFLDYYIKESTFIERLETKAKKTFKQDLDFSYDFRLARSEFQELKNSDSVPSYKTALITEDKLVSFNPRLVSRSNSFKDDFISDEKLLVSERLLKVLASEDTDYDEFIDKPDNYNLVIDEKGLSPEDFPNALILNTKYPVFKFEDKKKDNEEKAEIRDISFISSAQINLLTNLKLSPINLPQPQAPTPFTPIAPFIPASNQDIETLPVTSFDREDNLTNFDLGIRGLPANTHGIFLDPTEVVSEDNPIRVASSKSGGVSTFFIDEDGHIVMSVGEIFSGKKRDAKPDNSLELRDDNIGVLDTFSDKFGGQSLLKNDSLVNISFQQTESSEILEEKPGLILDVLPRQHTRYGNVEESFKVNGIEIPEGAIVVAVKPEDAKNRVNKTSDFNYFKVYDENGALISKFHRDSIQKNKKLNKIDLQSFNTEKGFQDGDGSNIYQSFSTKELFEGQNANDAVKSFLNIQADLADSLQLNINEKNKEWHKDLYKNFKAQGISYTNPTLEVNDKEKAAELYIAEKRYVDETAKELDREQFVALVELEGARAKVHKAKEKLDRVKENLKEKGYSKIKIQKQIKKEKKEIKNVKKEVESQEKEFKQIRKDYDNYIKTREVPKPKVTKIVKTTPKVLKKAVSKAKTKAKVNKKRRKR